MTRCPDNATLERLLADDLPAGEQRDLDAHLGGCAACKRRIDDLAGVSGFRSLMGDRGSDLVVESVHLRSAMERLRDGPAVADRRADLPDLLPPTSPGCIGRLGDIDIRRVIGRGGMGVVYEGHDTALDRTVAVKVLSPHLLGDGEAKSRFLREAQAAAALTHEHVVTIHAIGESAGQQYLVLQFVPGESLADRIEREGAMPIEEVARIGAQVARGLAAAHARGLIHRDIKPANILLDADTGTARVADFGLAKRTGAASVTDVGVVAGTPAYMSPEQAVDAPLDARSDLFSLGVVLYHASSGQLPFAAESPLVVLNQIRTLDPRPLREVNPAVPGWFASIVGRLLAKQPAERTATAAEVAGLLERKQAASRPRPSRALITVVGLCALMAIALAAYRGRPIPPPAAGFAVADVTYSTLADAVTAALDDGVITVYGDGPYPTPSISIDGKRLTVRAAAGAAPKFVPDTAGDGGPLQFLVTNTDLRLEGLDVQWTNPAPPQAGLDFTGTRRVIMATNSRLTLNNCRVVSGRGCGAVWAAGRELVVRHCHLVAPSGSCLTWRPESAAGPIRIEGCWLDGHTAIMVMPFAPAMPRPPALMAANNTIVAERAAVRLLLDSPPRTPIGLTLRRNIVHSTSAVVALDGLRAYPRNLATPAIMAETLRAAVAWKEEANVYAKGTVYLAGTPPRQGVANLPSDLRSLDAWLAFWKQPGSGSVEAALRLAEGASGVIDAASGAVPHGTGADPARLGPGGR